MELWKANLFMLLLSKIMMIIQNKMLQEYFINRKMLKNL